MSGFGIIIEDYTVKQRQLPWALVIKLKCFCHPVFLSRCIEAFSPKFGKIYYKRDHLLLMLIYNFHEYTSRRRGS